MFMVFLNSIFFYYFNILYKFKNILKMPITKVMNKYHDKKRRYDYIRITKMLNINNPDYEAPPLYSDTSDVHIPSNSHHKNKEEKLLEGITFL